MSSEIERLAMAIEGPHLPVPESSPYTLGELREVRWEACSGHERAVRIAQVKSLLRALLPPSEGAVEAAAKAMADLYGDDWTEWLDEARAAATAFVTHMLEEGS